MKRFRAMKRAAAGALVLPLLATGCSLLPGQTVREIDPPQVQYESEQTMAEPNDEALAQQSQMTVYLKDRGGYIAPVSIMAALDDEANAPRRALEVLVEGGSYEGTLPEGFHGLLPQGTQVNGLTVDPERKLATVDFSGPFADYNVQDERKMLEAVTWTLTGFADIDKVDIHYEGEKLNEMPVDGFPLDEPLSRAMGINLELAPGAGYSGSMPVTLYFSALSAEDEQYYVPVTRLVERSDDAALAAMRQLIAGPTAGMELNGVMTPDVEVAGIKVEGDTATVELEDGGFEEGQAQPAEMLQAVVLAVTENTGASKVQIRMNGTSDVMGTDNRSYSEPVARPEHVNALKA